MKGSCGLVASVFAASTAALASSSNGDVSFTPCCCEGFHSATSSSRSAKSAEAGNSEAAKQDKFAPRFDGLRFIETLITAHR